MRKLIHAFAFVAGLSSLAVTAAALPLTGKVANDIGAPSVSPVQTIAWHCWNTKHYSQRLHRFLRACGDTGKTAHPHSNTAALTVHHKAPTSNMSSY
jgi:hypothetical protein